jgi:putative phosphoesterase
MKIGIISDSHDHRPNITKAVEIFKEHKVKYVLHAGDIIAPFAARPFGHMEGVKFIAVFGNNDGDKLLLDSTVKSFGGQIHNDFRGEIGGRKIFMIHSCSAIEEIAASEKYDIVICGHTHKTNIRKFGRTLYINPGESTDWLTDEPAVVVLELDDMKTETIMLNR